MSNRKNIRVRFLAYNEGGKTVWRVKVPFLIFFWQFIRVRPMAETPMSKWPIAKFCCPEEALDAAIEYYRESGSGWISRILEG